MIKLPYLLRTAVLLLLMVISVSLLKAGEPITISKDFTLFTTQNLKGYTQPLVTSIEQSINSNMYTSASYEERYYFGLDLSVMGMFIPNSQKTFNAERPDKFGDVSVVRTAEIRDGIVLLNYTKDNYQPTIYGGKSTPIFAVPQNSFEPDSFYKTATFVEGNNISFMAGLPTLQLIAGFPTRTELRLRFLALPVQDEMLWYWGAIVNQQFDHWFKIFPEEYKMALALNGAYHSMSRNPGLSISSWAAGVHWSKLWDFEKSGQITGYFGFQLENLTGTFEAVKDTSGMSTDIIDSPYLEVREPVNYAKQQGWYDDQGKPQPKLAFDLENQNKFRLVLGFSYKYSFLELHGDFAYANQPMLTAGITFWLGGFGGKQKLEPGETIEKID